MRKMTRCKGNAGTEQGTAREGLASLRGQRCLYPHSPSSLESLRARGPSGAARTSGHATSPNTSALLRGRHQLGSPCSSSRHGRGSAPPTGCESPGDGLGETQQGPETRLLPALRARPFQRSRMSPSRTLPGSRAVCWSFLPPRSAAPMFPGHKLPQERSFPDAPSQGNRGTAQERTRRERGER